MANIKSLVKWPPLKLNPWKLKSWHWFILIWGASLLVSYGAMKLFKFSLDLVIPVT